MMVRGCTCWWRTSQPLLIGQLSLGLSLRRDEVQELAESDGKRQAEVEEGEEEAGDAKRQKSE